MALVGHRNNYTKLSDQCILLSKTLTEVLAQNELLRMKLAEVTALNKKIEAANRELRQQLEALTDNKSLQVIGDRMGRYKQECEALKLTVAQLQGDQCPKERENQETFVSLQNALEQHTR